MGDMGVRGYLLINYVRECVGLCVCGVRLCVYVAFIILHYSFI